MFAVVFTAMGVTRLHATARDLACVYAASRDLGTAAV